MLDDLLLTKLAAVEQRYEEISGKLSDPAVVGNRQTFQKMSKEHADIRDLVDAFRSYRELSKRAVDAREMQKDPEMRELAYDEEKQIVVEQGGLEERIKILLPPRDPNDGQEHHARAARGHRRRGSRPVRRGSVPHVFPLRRAPALVGRDRVLLRGAGRRHQGGRRPDQGSGRLQPAEVRVGRPPGAAGAGQRKPRAASIHPQRRSP